MNDVSYQVDYQSKDPNDVKSYPIGPMSFEAAVGTYGELQLEGFAVRVRRVGGPVVPDYTSGDWSDYEGTDITDAYKKGTLRASLLKAREGLEQALAMYEEVTEDYVRAVGPEWIDTVFNNAEEAKKLVQEAIDSF